MFKAIIRDADAVPPYKPYDSVLELPNGRDPNQNAWLTLQLRIRLNFVDSKNPHPPLTVVHGGKPYARDYDGYSFPALDWPDHLVERFMREYVKVAERTWNWQFVLKTPRTYAGLDHRSGNLIVRPNVLCLFRMSVEGPKGFLDVSPAAGPLRTGHVHRTINVVNLSLATREARRAGDPTPKNVEQMNSRSFRSDSSNYDDRDLFRPAVWQEEHHTFRGNTVGHEVGHALGQCHIMGLKGNPDFQLGAARQGDLASYGRRPAPPANDRERREEDRLNIMGEGDRVYLNAVSWQERIALHTGVDKSRWEATGIMSEPTRKRPSAAPAPAQW